MSQDSVLRPFSKSDWYGWAGAEPFSSGMDPLIGNIVVKFPSIGPLECEVICDNGGIGIYTYEEGVGLNDSRMLLFEPSEAYELLAILISGEDTFEPSFLENLAGAEFEEV